MNPPESKTPLPPKQLATRICSDILSDAPLVWEPAFEEVETLIRDKQSLELRLNEALAKLAEATKDKERLVNRLIITNAAWVNELGCYPLPYGTKRHIRDILQLNEKAIDAAMKGDK